MGIKFFKQARAKFFIFAAALIVSHLILQGALLDKAWGHLPDEARFFLFISMGIAWFITFGALTHLYKSWIAPLKRLERGVEAAALSNLEYKIDLPDSDEFGRIARSVESVCSRLASTDARMGALVERAVDEISSERESLSMALEHIGAGVVIINRDGLTMLCNQRADHHLEPKSSIIGHPIFKYVDQAMLRALMDESRESGSIATAKLDDETLVISPYTLRGEHEGYVLTFWPKPGAQMKLPKSRGARPEFYDFSLLSREFGAETSHTLTKSLREILIVSFDTETTGLEPSKGDRIISIGATRIRNGSIRSQETFETLIDPKMPIPASSIEFHHITDKMVRGAPEIGEALDGFFDFADGAVLLGHNVAFDLKFINIHLESVGAKPLATPTLDTLLLSYALHDHYEAHNLKDIAERLGVKVVGLHTALGDALTTAEVFLKLLPILSARGVATLFDAIEFSKKAFAIRKEQGKF